MKRVADVVKYNQEAWNREVAKGNIWTKPVQPEVIAAARAGKWELVLTPTKPVPQNWYPALQGSDTLCLASGGGQQGPILAAAGARVTVYDNSPAQLAQDRLVAEREGLDMRLVQGDMQNLAALEDASFDFIFHPVSNVFAEDVYKVWREAYRVLRPGGVMLAGFSNPFKYIFDYEAYEEGKYIVCRSLPYSDLEQLPAKDLDQLITDYEPLEYSHTLEEQIGGQLQAGFVLTGFYEDKDAQDAFSKYAPLFCATRALKVGQAIY
jgi:ubiquinone/menaquinone biosynthesis C-methylase UbiE